MIIHTSSDSIDFSNRAFSYGDGLFETMLVVSSRISLLKYHLARLCNGAARLGIHFDKDDAAELAKRIQALVANEDVAVVKVVLTRVAGGRGYRSLEEADSEVFLQVFSGFERLEEAFVKQGVAVRECKTRLACQPLLAGLKHLNRLENVLARNEWYDEQFYEGLMLDTNGLLIEATQSNVFFLIGERWLTPELNYSGVNGVFRTWLLEKSADLGINTAVSTLSLDDLNKAEGCFVCNSVNGILPVRSVTTLKGQNYQFSVEAAFSFSQLARSVLN